MILKKALMFLFFFSSNSSLAAEYWLIPGYIKSGNRSGGEITLAINEDAGDCDGVGFVVGAWQDPTKETSVEIQKHTQGHLIFSASAGVGAYRSKSSSGMQATIALQFWTPFLMFAREQIQTSPIVVAKKPQFGLMFKLPLPVPDFSRFK